MARYFSEIQIDFIDDLHNRDHSKVLKSHHRIAEAVQEGRLPWIFLADGKVQGYGAGEI